ncbi:MAG TPA: DUF4221 family protein [Flavobacterium sp.]|uniref:DUF4221 family protein n=1 Tax=Flavobacterium sp. TaxID=239 RepID=UPI002C3CF998|nr:DUF4221 family protein [Flavobacterium sp.]HSD14135.1 DUF4221 family protein [Flavobacterium sp.]
MQKILYSFLCGILFISCSKQAPTLTSVKEISFNIGTPFSDRTIFHDKNKFEYLAFADYYTKSKLSFFTLNGKLKKEIPLNEITRNGEEIDRCIIKSLDSIVILGRYNNRVWLINETGNVLKQLNLNTIVPDKINEYEFSSSADNSFNGENLLLFSAWRSNSNDVEPEKDKDYQKYFYNRYNNSYSFLELKNIFNNYASCKYRIKGFNKQFEKNSEIAHMILPLYFTNNNDLFVYSIHCDTLYNYELPSYKLKTKIKIKSKHTSIGERGYNCDKEIIDHQSHTNNIAHYGGVIANVVYDKFRKLYFVTVPHKIDDKKEPEKKKLNRPFSVLIYNNKWKQLNELVFQSGKHNFFDLMVCKEGLLISKNVKENKNYNPKIARYELFKINN